MKTKLPLFSVLLWSAASLSAAPLPATTAVHTKPDASSPAVTFLKAGSEPTVAEDAAAATPAGWLAVALPGPFEVYVENKNLLKDLSVRPGTELFLAPKSDSGVLTVFEPDDHAEITGLHGKWTQLRLDKKLTGYIRVGSEAAPAATPSPVSPAPVPPASAAAQNVTAPRQPAAASSVSDNNAPALPRLFRGQFVSTRSRFHPRRPYDWALVDDAGARVAYLDVTKLLLTDQIENYAGHTVVVYGAAQAVPDTRDIVIRVESLQLK
jgi:hypothetical protein